MRIAAPAAVFGAVLTAASLVPSFGFAAATIVPGTGGHAGPGASSTTNAHKLVAVVIDTGSPDLSLVPGFNTVDSTTATCAKPSCTISVNIATEAGGQSSTGNLWAACAVVDGNYAANGCPYLGELPADGSYASNFARQTFAVARGSHSVSFQIYVINAAVAGLYDVQYQVLAP